MYFTAREWLQIIGIGCLLLVVIGGPLCWGIHASRKLHRRLRANVEDRPLVSWSIDAALMKSFLIWQIERLGATRRVMGRRTWILAAWVYGIITLAFTALGLARDKLLDGALIGLSFSTIIMGSAGLGVGLVALLVGRQRRRLARQIPSPAQVSVAAEGILIEPGAFQAVAGSVYKLGWYSGTPTVLEIASRRPNGKGSHHWQFLHAPVPAHEIQRVHAALAPLRANAPGNQTSGPG